MTTTSHNAMTLSRRIGVRILTGTAITAAGFLTLSAPAQAHPMLPLDPPCTQWGFPGDFSLTQSNGATVHFNATGSTLNGEPAEAQSPGGGKMQGFVSGGVVEGYKLLFSIDWNGPLGRYTGTVGNDGFAHGDTADLHSSARAHWDSTVPLECTTHAALLPPKPPPAGPPADTVVTPFPGQRAVPPLSTGQKGPTATVISDVDVYDVPGGNGNKIGILRSGRQVQLAGSNGLPPAPGQTCKPKDWCDVVIPELPPGNGWVWDEFLKF